MLPRVSFSFIFFFGFRTRFYSFLVSCFNTTLPLPWSTFFLFSLLQVPAKMLHRLWKPRRPPSVSTHTSLFDSKEFANTKSGKCACSHHICVSLSMSVELQPLVFSYQCPVIIHVSFANHLASESINSLIKPCDAEIVLQLPITLV